jgi:hypothetical protein
LDRGDDVGELSCSRLLQSGKQSAVASHLGAIIEHHRPAIEHCAGVAEQLVLDPQQPASSRGEMASPHQPHRCSTRGPIEGLGDRRPPVHHQRLLVVVGHGNPPDVVGIAAGLRTIDPSEHQAGITDVEIVEAAGDVALDHLPFPAGLLGAALADFDH